MHGEVEHITLDGGTDSGAAASPQAPRAILRRFTIPTGRAQANAELSVLEGHYLGVRAVGSRGEVCSYQFDLRFADPTPVRVRHVPWVRLLLAIGLIALGLVALALKWPAIVTALGAATAFVLFTVAIGAVAGYGLFRWTTESLQLRSFLGDAVLVSMTGELGAARRYEPVFAELSGNVVAATLARPHAKPQFLRDAMREHYRLRKLGVLDEKQYQSSKAAILAAH